MTDKSDAMSTFNQQDLAVALRELEAIRRSRLRLLIGVALFALLATAVPAAYFGFVLIGGADRWTAFATGLAFTAGPGVLLVILAYLMLFRSKLKEQFALKVIVPILRSHFTELRYKDTGTVDQEEIENSQLFEGEIDHIDGEHFIQGTSSGLHLHGHGLRTYTSRGPRRPEFDGLFFAITHKNEDSSPIEPAVRDSDIRLRAGTKTLYLALPYHVPRINWNPLGPAVEDTAITEFSNGVKSLLSTANQSFPAPQDQSI
jgi:hypothetical protein